MSAVSAMLVAVALGTAIVPQADVTPTPRDAEIKSFASAMALARTVSERCAGILINVGVLNALRESLHIGPTDEAALGAEGRYALNLLSRAIAVAPSPQAWCDATYGQYGPEGTIIPELMQRR